MMDRYLFIFFVCLCTSTPQQEWEKPSKNQTKKWRQPHSPGHSRHKSFQTVSVYAQLVEQAEDPYRVSSSPFQFSFLLCVCHSLFVSQNQLKFQSAGLDTQLYALANIPDA
jgi:hypothetical protein